MAKKILALLLLAVLAVTLTSCGQKCIACGEKATRSYTNPTSAGYTLSLSGNESFELNRGATVPVCDKHFEALESGLGKSK